jgi:hypothetical protein
VAPGASGVGEALALHGDEPPLVAVLRHQWGSFPPLRRCPPRTGGYPPSESARLVERLPQLLHPRRGPPTGSDAYDYLPVTHGAQVTEGAPGWQGSQSLVRAEVSTHCVDGVFSDVHFQDHVESGPETSLCLDQTHSNQHYMLWIRIKMPLCSKCVLDLFGCVLRPSGVGHPVFSLP